MTLRGTRARLSCAFAMALVCTLPVAAGLAQPAGAPAAASADDVSAGGGATATPVLTDPVSGERYVQVRPSEALQRGRWAVPAWLVWGLGALALLTGTVALARRSARARRGR